MTAGTRMSSADGESFAIEDDDWTWTGKVFKTVAAATGNERRPMVVRWYDGPNSWSVDDDRRRRRPGKSDTGTSWFKCAGANAMLNTICYQRKFEIHPFWETSPVQYREDIGHVIVATKSKHLKPVHTGDYSRRFRRQIGDNLSPFNLSPFSATVALFCDSRRFWWQACSHWRL